MVEKRQSPLSDEDMQNVFDEAKKSKVSVGFKDMGAGGIVCSTSEICSAGGYGAEIDLDKVHVSLRDLPQLKLWTASRSQCPLSKSAAVMADRRQLIRGYWELPEISQLFASQDLYLLLDAASPVQ